MGVTQVILDISTHFLMLATTCFRLLEKLLKDQLGGFVEDAVESIQPTPMGHSENNIFDPMFS
jgi:hypothetical protein